MTELSADGARAHETGSLWVAGGSGAAKRTDVLGALRSYVFSRLALETTYGGGGGWFIWDDDRVVTGAGLHNHLQSSGERSMSVDHTRSSSSVTSTPTSLSWCCISLITFPGRENGSDEAARGEWKGSSGQLQGRIDCGVGGREGVSGGGSLSGAWGMRIGAGAVGQALVFLRGLNCSLHWVIGPVIGSPLVLREQEDNSMENRGKVVLRENSQKSVESPVHQQDKDSGVGSSEGRVKGFGNLHWKAWDCQSSEELSKEYVVLKDDNGLGEGGVIMVEGGGDDPFIEDGVSEDVDQEYLSLGNGEAE